MVWRRGWDSNPRYACAYSGFRDRRVQPLCHLSAGTRDSTNACPARLAGLEHSRATHVWAQRFRDRDTAIRVLEVFQDRHQRAAHREAGAVERVHELGLLLLIAKPRLHAPRLEGLEVAA